MEESEEELKCLLIKVKEKSEKVGLKLNIQKKKIMASAPITSWQIDGETMETVTDFIFLGSKITADCDMKLKDARFLKKINDQPRQHTKKHRHYLSNKGPSSQGYVFFSSHVWMWVGPLRNLSTKELMLMDCSFGEDSWESLRLQGDPTSPS